MRTVLTAPYTLNSSIEGEGESIMSRTALLPSRTLLGVNDTLKVFNRQSAKMIPMIGVHPDGQWSYCR